MVKYADVDEYEVFPRCLLELDFTQVEWLPDKVTIIAKDYTEVRKSIQTGWIRDSSGYGRDAAVMDISPHSIKPESGLRLGGTSACFGKYTSDDGKPISNLGHLKLPQVETSGVALSVHAKFVYHSTPAQHNTLFFMGDGWGNHFSLRHYRPNNKLQFTVCPNVGGRWTDRAEIYSVSTLVEGRTYSIAATLAQDGSVCLYLDGKLEACGIGLRKRKQFGPADVKRRRGQNYVGRWMRPDQSTPLNAGILSLALFDGQLNDEDVAALHDGFRVRIDSAPVPVAKVIAESWDEWAKN